MAAIRTEAQLFRAAADLRRLHRCLRDICSASDRIDRERERLRCLSAELADVRAELADFGVDVSHDTFADAVINQEAGQ